MPTKEKHRSTDETLLKKQQVLCYHCGIACIDTRIAIKEKTFCCEGCRLVYEILNENGLCNYYELQSHPGLSQIKPVRSDKYDYLDNKDIAGRLLTFTDGRLAIITFYIPGIHCSSCMWLLEHMCRLNKGITHSRLNFNTKELTLHFDQTQISLRKVVELLATIGYEPHISMDGSGSSPSSTPDKKKIYKLGVAGFCFGNIMMMSFPEYFSGAEMENDYTHLFRVLNMILSIPVFFYCASEFFVSAWNGLKQRMLNIDAPIVLALIITYSRSLYEIISDTGSGYLDSMSGIVFFMLVGRVVQARAYRSISFHRDYKAYFPIAVNVVTTHGIEARSLQDLKEKDVVQLYNDELIPADALIIKGTARVDYSFVTGESEPVTAQAGQRVYAGGRHLGEQLHIQVIKPVAGSYLTTLWNHFAFSKNKIQDNKDHSAVHILSRYFTYILLILAGITAVYWSLNDASKILPCVSAMLIVACPCALLLSSTYTNGNLLRLLSANGLFLRDASVIEQIGNINHVTFDKTGTLTRGSRLIFSGASLEEEEKDLLYTATSSSRHPYSQAIAAFLGNRKHVKLASWKETAGSGIEAWSENHHIKIGSASFAGAHSEDQKDTVYININDTKNISVSIMAVIRTGVVPVLSALSATYGISLLSGDNDRQRKIIESLSASWSALLFEQKPIDKLHYIAKLQKENKRVLMIGDGLNDAGALQQSNVGITLADDINNFTPSCDAILDATRFSMLPNLLKLAGSGKTIITLSFIISILYNIAGLFFAVQGLMSPMIAAILMPVSTVTIVLMTTGLSTFFARSLRLAVRS